MTLEDAERLGLPEELAVAVEVAMPEASLLLEAWQARSAEERDELIAIPPQPFYLREAHITVPRERPLPNSA